MIITQVIIINGQFHEWVFLIYYMGKVLKQKNFVADPTDIQYKLLQIKNVVIRMFCDFYLGTRNKTLYLDHETVSHWVLASAIEVLV